MKTIILNGWTLIMTLGNNKNSLSESILGGGYGAKSLPYFRLQINLVITLPRSSRSGRRVVKATEEHANIHAS